MSPAVGGPPELQRERAASRQTLIRRALLACGIGYGLAYVVANDVVAAAMWDGYNRIDQAISELSGKGAPSRTFLTAMLPVFALLVCGFGAGVWQAAGGSRALRVTGGILVAQAVMFPLWLLFPLSSREELVQGAGGANDVGHLVLSALAVFLILTEMGCSAAALGMRFRVFAILMAITTLVAGGYVATTVGDVEVGNATPWMGFVERVSYGAWLLWMAVLAIVLMRRRPEPRDAAP